MTPVDADTPVIWVWLAGANIGPHHANPRKARCVECREWLEPGAGYRRKMDSGLRGTGYLCKACVTKALWSRKAYVYNRWTSFLTPYRVWTGGFPIAAADLVQGWESQGAAGLRVAAETGRDRARRAWLETHHLPYSPE